MAKFDKALERNRYLKYILISIPIILLIFYFKVFFTRGIYFNGTFLKKEVIATETHYLGKDEYGSLHLTVKGKKNIHKSSEVTFRLPGNLNFNYTVNFIDKDYWNTGIDSIVDQNGAVLFEGGDNGNSNILIQNNNKRPIFEDPQSTRSYVVRDKYYKISPKTIAGLAYGDIDRFRGNFEILFVAIIFFVVTIIDINFPLFFFTLNHFLSVRNPEPSDFYLAMQRASWVILPLLGVILLILAVTT